MKGTDCTGNLVMDRRLQACKSAYRRSLRTTQHGAYHDVARAVANLRLLGVSSFL